MVYFKVILKNIFSNLEVNVKSILYFFNCLDKEILNNKNIKNYVGLCLSGIIYDCDKKIFYIINLGNTYIYILDEKYKIVFKNILHDLDNKKEYQRIIKYNKKSCINKNRYKKLSMTRTLGDLDCKSKINEPLIPIPEICILKNTKKYIFFLFTKGLSNIYDTNKILKILNNLNMLDKYLNNYIVSNNNVCCNILTNNVFIKHNKINNEGLMFRILLEYE